MSSSPMTTLPASAPTKVLHVEDDALSRQFIAFQLKVLRDFDFDVRFAESEPQAVEVFDEGGFDLVLLDYHLVQGNGLSLLRLLRARDEIVPIMALSGVASPEIAAQLLEAGADDYIGKKTFQADEFAKSVREALRRTALLRGRALKREPANGRAAFEQGFNDLVHEFVALVGERFQGQLGRLEDLARDLKVTESEVQRLMDALGPDVDPALARPIVLEVLLRLFGASDRLGIALPR